MRNVKYNYLKISCFFGVLFSFTIDTLADDNPEATDRKAQYYTNQESGAGDVPGQQCINYLNAPLANGRPRGWNQGTNYKSNGSTFYVAVGVSEIKAPTSNPNYITSSMNASINAQLDSKRKLVEAMSTQITSDIVSTMTQQVSQGQMPEFIGTSEKPAKEVKDYEQMSIYEKTKVLVNQQLDKMVDQETKDKIKNKTISERELQSKIDQIVNQSTFKDSIKSNASGSVRGMKSVYSAFSVEKGDKQTMVCNVGLWSSKLAADVDAMTTGDYSRLQNLKKGKPLQKYIPHFNRQFDRKVYKEEFDAFESLLGTFGAFMVRNERGEMSIISYAQEKPATDSATSKLIAFDNATLRARRAIIQLRDENIDTSQSMTRQEATTEYRDGMMDYWSDNSSERRTAASASGTLKGDYELYRWNNNHTLNGQPVVGVVVAWTPTNAMMIDEISETLSESPQSSYDDYSSDYEDSSSSASGGSSAGDDEDDF